LAADSYISNHRPSLVTDGRLSKWRSPLIIVGRQKNNNKAIKSTESTTVVEG